MSPAGAGHFEAPSFVLLLEVQVSRRRSLRRDLSGTESFRRARVSGCAWGLPAHASPKKHTPTRRTNPLLEPPSSRSNVVFIMGPVKAKQEPSREPYPREVPGSKAGLLLAE